MYKITQNPYTTPKISHIDADSYTYDPDSKTCIFYKDYVIVYEIIMNPTTNSIMKISE